MKPSVDKYVRLRSALIGCFFLGLFSIIAAKAVYLQVYRGSWLSRKAANQYEKSFVYRGKRGTIYDRKHREMAVSNTVTSIAAHPLLLDDGPAAAKMLAKKISLNRRPLEQKLKSGKPFVWIKRHVSPKEAKTVRELNLKGIVFKTEQSRFYPNKLLASQVLGFSGIDGDGLEGIEYYYDSSLKGHGEKLTVLQDALGRELVLEKDLDLSPGGHNIILTIDRTIQFITERALENSVKQFEAKSGIAIVMAPKTGAILALAHVPLFNANSFRDYSQKEWRNRAITDPFEPGSTFKIFSAAAVIESGNITPHTIFFCENGEYNIGRDIIHDTRSHGWLSLQQIVKYSSNIGIVKVGEATGSETLYQTLKAFGFGDKTGIDCPGETSGSLSHFRRWSKLDAGAIAFGQGISASAIQLVTGVAAIANDGVLMKPYIVQAITDKNGRLIKNLEPVPVRRAISVKTARLIKNIMHSVIDSGGTGIKAALQGYSVSGKTGTAQKTDDQGSYGAGMYTASFIGFTPTENPELAILVIVDEPQKHHYGGVVAAPVFRKIAQETLQYLNIPPDNKKGSFTVSLDEEVQG